MREHINPIINMNIEANFKEPREDQTSLQNTRIGLFETRVTTMNLTIFTSFIGRVSI